MPGVLPLKLGQTIFGSEGGTEISDDLVIFVEHKVVLNMILDLNGNLVISAGPNLHQLFHSDMREFPVPEKRRFLSTCSHLPSQSSGSH